MTNKPNSGDKFARLPEFARPTRYEIWLAPSLETFKFEGREKIHLEIVEATNFLQLHSSGLQIQNASLKLANAKMIDLKIQIDAKWSLLSLQIPEQIEPQKAELEISFNGKIRSELEGFYRSPYRDAQGKEQFLASTQFESTYARKAFPCWDEPIYKAEFDIELQIEGHLCALSNMDVVGERQGEKEGTRVVKFGRTPPMSTYLVAFAIGQFEFLQDQTKGGCRVRVYTVPGKREKAHYALKVAVKAFEWFSEWYGVEMPLPKCDLIGIPEFAMGAMENWGLITFREAVLLFDPLLTSSAIKQRITTTVTHEIGHFWFGNLVTMKWWNDLWLKEGFASFMEYVFTGYNFPEFKIWLDFVNGETRVAMRLDALRSSHPIEIPIDNPNELDEIYDNITYAKSNSIIRMLFNYLGESTIQRGLRIYLGRHKYSNTETKDLWECLDEASGIDVNSLMSSWTRQMGFPLVEVEEAEMEGNRRELVLSQRRFLADGGSDEGNALWQVPIPITVSADPTKPKEKLLLKKAKEKFVIEGVEPGEWVKLNSGFASFFRVHYSDQMFRRLLEGIKRGEMDVLDRFQICNDIFALVQSGQSKMSKFLELFAAYALREDNLVVWQSMNAGLAEIDQMLGHSQGEGGRLLKDQFHAFVCKLVEPVAAKYGWEPKEGEDMQTGQLRALLLSLLARSHHQPTVQIGLSKFNAHIQRGIQLVPDLRSVIFGIAARTNDPKMAEQLCKIMENCNFSEIERACILALGQCSDPKLLREIYKKGIEGKAIKSQDIFYLFVAANHSANLSTQKQNWDYFKQNVDLFVELWGSPTATMFQECLKFANDRFCSESAAEDLQKFCNSNFDEQILKVLDRPIQQILETIKLNGRMLENNLNNLGEYFRGF